MNSKRFAVILIIVAAVLFLGWRFVRPMNIFIVTDNFERPVSTAHVPELLDTLRADECAACHQDFFDEWSTSIHSQAWTDPYYQADLRFDRSQQICLNCHIPLDRQQESLVVGFRDAEKWDPILVPNPDFDAALQKEGVTCAACHLREGKILGVFGIEDSPHPVRKIASGNEICVKCHVVSGERWDAFMRFPPCGTVAEIGETKSREAGNSGEVVVPNVADLGCVDCHMPLVERPLVEGGKVRRARRHLWRGGHDPKMVKSGLDIKFVEVPSDKSGKRAFALTITNVGAAHYLPTGTPDRHLAVSLRVLDARGGVIDEQTHILERKVMWRPFIIDLWDTRLPRGEPRNFEIDVAGGKDPAPATIEARIDYYLVAEKRRKRIGYENTEPTFYTVFQRRIDLSGGVYEKKVK